MTDTKTIAPTGTEAGFDLDKLEALASAATKGPWLHRFDPGNPEGVQHGVKLPGEHGAWVCDCLDNADRRTDGGNAGDRNAQFIAAANPAAILALIALARRAAPDSAAKQCVICGADEPRTGTCGSDDPRALCNRPDSATQPDTAASASEHVAFNRWFHANGFTKYMESMWAAWEARASLAPVPAQPDAALALMGNPVWGAPDLYARLVRFCREELQLAQHQGKVKEWVDALLSAAPYEAAKFGYGAQQGAAVKVPPKREPRNDDPREQAHAAGFNVCREFWLAAKAPAAQADERRNIAEVTRTSDMGLTIRFMSARACSAFERYLAAPAAQAVIAEQDRRALELANAALIAAQPRDIRPEGWKRHEEAINVTNCALHKPAASPASTPEAAPEQQANGPYMATKPYERLFGVEAAHAQQPAAPYGYVLKTGHGNRFSEDLAHVHEEVRHMWKPVYLAATTAGAAETDKWHDAVLAECMRVESCYKADDPIGTLAALIDWHANGSDVASTNKVLADNYLRLTCGGAAETSEDARDAARWRFRKQFLENNGAIMWTRTRCQLRQSGALVSDGATEEEAIDAAMRATQQEGGK